MNTKTKTFIHWGFAAIVGLIFIGGGISKLSGSEESYEMAGELGIDMNTFMLLGIVEIISAILFIIPRTGIIGTLLLVAYMGGAIATHLLIDPATILFPISIQAVVWIAALFRFPEIKEMLVPKQNFKN